jgi:membrane protease subunit HflK
MKRAVVLLISLVLLAVVASGLVSVAPGEAAIVRRFGRLLPDAWGPGLHLGLPLGLDRVERVETGRVRRVEIGLADVPGPADDPGAGEYLTGDLNLIHARAVIQYRVADPAKFVLAAEGREATLTRLAEACLARALARRGVDDALRAGRAAIAADVQASFEGEAREYGLGVAVLGVSLTDAQPPAEVQPDFAAAQSARSDLERKRNEARARAEALRIDARAKARATDEAARAGAERALAMARGRADRFLALLAEAGRSRRLTVRRLYLDALRDGLARARRKVLLTPDEPIDMSLFGPEK